jgi:hypothetical protein
LVTNQTRLIARNQCLAAGAGLLLNMALVPLLGFMGAGVSAVIAFSVLAGLQAITSARFLTWRWPLTSLWRVLAASAAMSLSVLLLQAGFRSHSPTWQTAGLLISIFIGALIYGIMLWVLKEISLQQFFGFFRPDQRQSSVHKVVGETGQK